MMRKFILCFIVIICSTCLKSQELRCNVQIVSSKIQGTNKNIFRTLQSEVYEFMNTRSWTNHVYSNFERIECNILINLTEQISTDEFRGTLQIQSRRPVYNTSYSTAMLNWKDNDIQFTYVEYDPLEFSETEHISNLTSLLAYYAYIILGIDYDSFSIKEGTDYFKKAETIVNNAQNAKEKGWRSFESNKRNRYWLIENILNDKYSPIREFIYKYHRLGLDRMHEKLNESREAIAESVTLLRKVYRDRPNFDMPFLDLIFDAKGDEFVNIFRESFTDEKVRVVNMLNEIDPANAEKYKRIMADNNN
ncbi:DUF4835 family protein [Bacteroidota bacterium]